MNRAIGSEFSLSPMDLFHGGKGAVGDVSGCVYLSSGRDAIWYSIRSLGLSFSDEVMLPAYLCKEVVKPFVEAGVGIKFYKVKRTLAIDLEDITTKISSKTKAILFINYFGFPQPLELIQKLRERYQGYLIEDNVQALLTQFSGYPLNGFGDIVFSSYRKFIPTPDGACLSFKNLRGPLLKVISKTSFGHFKFIVLRLLGLLLKYFNDKKSIFFDLAEKEIDVYPKPAPISRISSWLLKKVDFDECIVKRRKNYEFLLSAFKHDESVRPLYTELQRGVCPLGFPMLVKNRDQMRDHLIRNRIYPPIHWELPGEIDEKEFSGEWEISRNILTIPIDQRYDEDNMKYIVSIISEYSKGKN